MDIDKKIDELQEIVSNMIMKVLLDFFGSLPQTV